MKVNTKIVFDDEGEVTFDLFDFFDFQEYLLTILIRCEADKELEWETDRLGEKFSEIFGKKRTAYNRRVNFQILEVRKRVSQLLVQASRIFRLTGYIHRTN